MANETTNLSKIEQMVSDRISKQGGSIRNKAALGALIKIIPSVGEALHHVLTAGDEAIENEKLQFQLGLLCQLVEKIDCSISEMLEKIQENEAGSIKIDGKINVRGEHVENITGLEIAQNRSATIKPGTVVNVEGTHATNVIGVKI